VAVSDVALTLETTGDIYTDTEVQFSADISPDNADKPYTYTIDYQDGTSTTTMSSADPLALSHTFAATGTYDVEIAVWNCDMTEAVTDTVQVVISEQTVVECVAVSDVALTLETTGDIYTDTEVQFSADITPDNADKPYTYTIDYQDGTSTTTTSSDDPLALRHTFAATGTYDVEIAVWNCEMTEAEAMTATVQVDVLSRGVVVSYDVALTPGVDSAEDIMGAAVTYMLQVQNLGNVEDTFALEVSGTWSSEVMPGTVTLDTQQMAAISVTVTIPAEAGDGEQDETTVTVTSQGDTSVSDTSTLTTTARWPKLYLPLVARNFK
jgi:PKD repeat protein